MRILFTSVGRRCELMQQFRSAAEGMGISLVLCGADASDTAPALAFCDKRLQVPRISDVAYLPALLRFCEEERVDALLPTIDTDLLLLSENKEKFARIGTRIVVSEPEMIRICRDKRETARFFADCGLMTPMPVDDVENYDQEFPCFVKPLNGSSSIDAYRAESREELLALAERVPDYIIQPFVTGEEYTVDIFCDFDGEPVYIAPRRRLAVRSGEVIKTQMVDDPQIVEECQRFLKKFRAIGPVTVQLIRGSRGTDKTKQDYFIEINPRYGGGAPLSAMAGADSATALLRLLNGMTPVAEEAPLIDTESVYCRFDQTVCMGNRPHRIERLSEALNVLMQDKISVAIFDMDDTLYSEKAYIRSGYRKIAESGLLGDGDGVAQQLWDAFVRGEPPVDTVMVARGFTDAAGAPDAARKEQILAVYRGQRPEIALYPEAREVLDTLRDRAELRLGLITDGRPEGQRAKIAALGIASCFDEIIITDELAGRTGDPTLFRKPCGLAFALMQRRFGVPAGRMAYVGDNLRKDFDAPLRMGMRAVWFDNADAFRKLFA